VDPPGDVADLEESHRRHSGPVRALARHRAEERGVLMGVLPPPHERILRAAKQVFVRGDLPLLDALAVAVLRQAAAELHEVSPAADDLLRQWANAIEEAMR
jgi:hypothetical protein